MRDTDVEPDFLFAVHDFRLFDQACRTFDFVLIDDRNDSSACAVLRFSHIVLEVVVVPLDHVDGSRLTCAEFYGDFFKSGVARIGYREIVLAVIRIRAASAEESAKAVKQACRRAFCRDVGVRAALEHFAVERPCERSVAAKRMLVPFRKFGFIRRRGARFELVRAAVKSDV